MASTSDKFPATDSDLFFASLLASGEAVGGSPGGDLPTSEADETPPSAEFTIIPSLRPMAFKNDDWWLTMTDCYTPFPPLFQLPVPVAVHV